MKKILLAVCFVSLSFAVGPCFASMVKHENGWVYPMDREPTEKEWKSWHSYSGHVGLDFMQSASISVRAIADGEIVDYSSSLSRYGSWAGTKGSAILVKHKTLEGRVFYAVYGHNNIKEDIGIGDDVKAGDVIGYTHAYVGSDGTRQDHIHFGIHPDKKDTTLPFRGVCSSSDDCGWVNPADFLSENSPYIKPKPVQKTYFCTYEPDDKQSPDHYEICWAPANVTCVNAEFWMENEQSLADADSSICEKAYQKLALGYWYADGTAEGWRKIFLGEEMNLSVLQCPAN